MSVWDVITAEAQKFGLPLGLVSPIILSEDPTADPKVVNAIGATGLLQLLPNGGQGAGYTQAQLQDPTKNLEIGLPYISKAYTQGTHAGLSGLPLLDFTASHSGHDSMTGYDSPGALANLAKYYSSSPDHGVSQLQSAAEKQSTGSSSSVFGDVGGAVGGAAGAVGNAVGGALGGTGNAIGTVAALPGDVGSAIGGGITAGFNGITGAVGSFVQANAVKVIVFVLAAIILLGAASRMANTQVKAVI